nr:sigma-54 dependent transcriptional regulator [Candidatus Photodesmus blepharus]
MIQNTVLIVEDDPGLREALVDTLTLSGYKCLESYSAEDALIKLKSHSIDIVVSDIQMEGADGLALLRNIKRNYLSLPVLLITAYASVEDAVSAIKEGAVDYITKPFSPEVLLNMVSRYTPIKSDNNGDVIVADNKSLKLMALADKVSKTNANVLILGPSGSGKEIISRYIHNASNRKNGPFIAINCAAIPDSMLEATLFGYEKGAFTGAFKACPGKFEQAQGGTILLDEVSEMDLNLQAKLLRVLQEREVERLGSHKSIKLDIRVLSTSNRDLKQYVQEANFREDLYYRLNVFPISWPALCERKGDIEPLIRYLIERNCKKLGLPIHSIHASAISKLLRYSWPGNVRELDNVIQRALILSNNRYITSEHILLENIDWENAGSLQQILESNSNSKTTKTTSTMDIKESNSTTLEGELQEQERVIILKTLSECNGRRKEMAKKLGISPRTLRYKLAKMKKLGIIPIKL